MTKGDFQVTIEEVNVMAQLADLKDADYENALLIGALIEQLIAKRLVTREEIAQAKADLDAQLHLAALSDNP